MTNKIPDSQEAIAQFIKRQRQLNTLAEIYKSIRTALVTPSKLNTGEFDSIIRNLLNNGK